MLYGRKSLLMSELRIRVVGRQGYSKVERRYLHAAPPSPVDGHHFLSDETPPLCRPIQRLRIERGPMEPGPEPLIGQADPDVLPFDRR